MAGRFGDADVAGDDGFVDLVAEEAAGIGGDQVGQVVAAVEHGQHDSLQAQAGVEAAADEVDGAHDLADAFQGEELALQRDQDGVGGHQAVQGEQAEAGRAVDQDVGVAWWWRRRCAGRRAGGTRGGLR